MPDSLAVGGHGVHFRRGKSRRRDDGERHLRVEPAEDIGHFADPVHRRIGRVKKFEYARTHRLRERAVLKRQQPEFRRVLRPGEFHQRRIDAVHRGAGHQPDYSAPGFACKVYQHEAHLSP